MSSQMRALGEEVGAPVGAVLEGGYDLDALAGSVAETMVALDGGAAAAGGRAPPAGDDAADVLGRYWEL